MTDMERFVQDLAGADEKVREAIAPARTRHIGLVVFPGMFSLDILGPKAVFEDLLATEVHVVGATREPIACGGRAQLLPDLTYADCMDGLDVLFVPGGGQGVVAAMRDAALLAFLQKAAATARYVTSVCTGSLILGAAGLLHGYRATTHWIALDVLSRLGATPVRERVVEDRNRITSAGVSAGLDLAFLVTARLAGEAYAKAEMLGLEYDPEPPFRAGSPAGAGEHITAAVRRLYAGLSRGYEEAAAASQSSRK